MKHQPQNQPQHLPKGFLLLLLVLLGASAQGNELRGIITNNEGVDQMQKKNSSRSLEKFTGALGDLPFSPHVHLNIGDNFLLQQEFEKAIKEFQQAIKNAPGDSAREKDVKFFAHFNQAVALTELKKIDEALEQYQMALEFRPDSVETKTNIELLASQQGSGGGEGKDDKQNKDNKDGKGKQDNKKDQKDPKDQKDQKVENPKPTPRPFKSEELSQQDVKRILEELKRQEEQIRARLQNEQRKDAPNEKDW
jgi:Ca-activated chloride channel homolog